MIGFVDGPTYEIVCVCRSFGIEEKYRSNLVGEGGRTQRDSRTLFATSPDGQGMLRGCVSSGN